MIKLITEYPYINDEGVLRTDLVRHYALDENGKKYKMVQTETGNEYDDAIDLYPCRYIYKATEIPVDNEDTIEE